VFLICSFFLLLLVSLPGILSVHVDKVTLQLVLSVLVAGCYIDIGSQWQCNISDKNKEKNSYLQ